MIVVWDVFDDVCDVWDVWNVIRFTFLRFGLKI